MNSEKTAKDFNSIYDSSVAYVALPFIGEAYNIGEAYKTIQSNLPLIMIDVNSGRKRIGDN